MPDYFPAFLDLRGRQCLVVGGGLVGERKALALLACGARVRVVSPRVTAGLQALAHEGRVVYRARRFRRWDVRGCVVVIAATGERRVDVAVAAEARRRRALVNVVDRPDHCDFISPSVLRRGELQVAVSTGGRSPALAREIRRRLEPAFASDAGLLVEKLGRERRATPTRAARISASARVAPLAVRAPSAG